MRAVRGRSIALLLVLLLGGCFPQAEAPTDSSAASPTAASPEAIASSMPASSTDSPRTATFNVEGEPTQVELERYETPQFVTAFPKGQFIPTPNSFASLANSFIPLPNSIEGGTGVRFNFSPTGTIDEEAYVQVFFPSEAISAAALTEQITTDSSGLLAKNGWQLHDADDPPPSYAWTRSAIYFYRHTPPDSTTGTIYVGEHQGKAFLVVTLFSSEYGEGFAPRAELILKNLELR